MIDLAVTEKEYATAQSILRNRKIALFIVAYNAETQLQSVIERIPKSILSLFAEILVIDDSSTDTTFNVASTIQKKYPGQNIQVYRTPYNRGYGGNQKLGYLYCIERGYDIVILLHGDGQYAPEYLPRMIAAFEQNPDAVFGSRMLFRRMALAGGMPVYKWVGNYLLTSFENRLLNTKLSEFHTGLRAYSVESLSKIPFVFNTDDFHFDTEIIVQAVAMGWKIVEVPIPTHYGDEVCHVNGMSYAWNCIKSVYRYHLVNLGIFYQRNYDFGLFEEERYQLKKSPRSLHQFVIRRGEFQSNMMTIELGAARGVLSSHIAPRVKTHFAVDIIAPDLASGGAKSLSLDLNGDFSQVLPRRKFDACIALDVIEHLDEPEKFLTQVFEILRPGGKIYISTANISYFLIRLSLLFGQFNYGKKGILDRTHKRLFNVNSFKQLLRQYGFEIEQVRGFAPPLTDFIRGGKLMVLLEQIHYFLSGAWPNLFAYNFLVTATRLDGIDDIFRLTVKRKENDTDELHARKA